MRTCQPCAGDAKDAIHAAIRSVGGGRAQRYREFDVAIVGKIHFKMNAVKSRPIDRAIILKTKTMIIKSVGIVRISERGLAGNGQGCGTRPDPGVMAASPPGRMRGHRGEVRQQSQEAIEYTWTCAPKNEAKTTWINARSRTPAQQVWPTVSAARPIAPIATPQQ